MESFPITYPQLLYFLNQHVRRLSDRVPPHDTRAAVTLLSAKKRVTSNLPGRFRGT